MENLVTVVTKYGNFNVDRKKLGDELKLATIVSEHFGYRPGEPINLTGTISDPISRELAHTYNIILKTCSRKNTGDKK